MSTSLTVGLAFHAEALPRGREALRGGGATASSAAAGAGAAGGAAAGAGAPLRGLLRRGLVRDYAELDRLGCVSRARTTQIANLTLLAPDIQKTILFLPRTARGRDPLRLSLALLQPIALTPALAEQRRLWARLRAR